jgi:hypothetical protein
MCLHFIYTKNTETYFNLDGTTKQGTNSFELVLQEIPQNNSISKFTLEERQIEEDTQFSSTGSLLINSYTMNYNSAETNQIEKMVVDDFELSDYQATIQTERNIITTDELLTTDKVINSIRLGNEYRQVVEALGSSTYRVNLAFSESGTFDLYTQGTFSKKYGLKRAFYDIDSTTEIDTEEEARNQFGFLMDAFQFGAPPHGGLAFGLDRLVAILGGQETIRDFIAFPKNNSGRDVMIDAPSTIDDAQLKELHIQLDLK